MAGGYGAYMGEESFRVADMISSNLPISNPTSGQQVKSFFDNRTQSEVTFAANQIDAVVGFFLKRNFDQSSARSTAIILLNQAKAENRCYS